MIKILLGMNIISPDITDSKQNIETQVRNLDIHDAGKSELLPFAPASGGISWNETNHYRPSHPHIFSNVVQ